MTTTDIILRINDAIRTGDQLENGDNQMNDTIIRRTYNRHGDCDFLTRMDNTPQGWCPVWCADRRQAARVTESYAADLLHHISLWRDQFCPGGIKGVEAIRP